MESINLKYKRVILDIWFYNGMWYAYTEFKKGIEVYTAREQIKGKNIEYKEGIGLTTDLGIRVFYVTPIDSRFALSTRFGQILNENKELKADIEMLTCKIKHIESYPWL